MSTFKTTIELEIEVEYTASKGMKGTRDRYGVPEEPDDPDELEIESVEVITSKPPCGILDILTPKQLDALEQEAWEHVSEQSEPPEKDRD